MCKKIYRASGQKTETESTNRIRVNVYHELIGEAAF